MDDDITLSSIAHLTPGYVGADLSALVRESAKSAVNRYHFSSFLRNPFVFSSSLHSPLFVKKTFYALVCRVFDNLVQRKEGSGKRLSKEEAGEELEKGIWARERECVRVCG